MDDFKKKMARIETLTDLLQNCGDSAARENARELVGTLLEIHGQALTNILQKTESSGPGGRDLVAAFARDPLTSNVLMLHDLHPLDFKTRVGLAIEAVQKTLRLHQGGIELLGVEENVVRLRLTGSCQGCPSSTQTLKQTVEETLFSMAPEIRAIAVEEALTTDTPAQSESYISCPSPHAVSGNP